MKHKTTSPKLKRILIYECVTLLLLFSCFVVLFIFINQFNRIVYTILPIVMSLLLAFGGIFLILYYKELKRITNNSLEYYKRILPNYFYDSLIIDLGFSLGVMIFSIREYNNTSFSILTSIYVAIFSLIFVLSTFILPVYKKYLSKSYIQLIRAKEKAKNNSDIKSLNSFQCEIFKNNMAFNNLSLSMIVATIVFCFTLIIYLILGACLFSYFILFSSIFFDLVFIGRLALLVKRMYTNDLDKLEKTIIKQNQEIDRFLSAQKETKNSELF